MEEWSGKESDETERKTERKEGNREDIHRLKTKKIFIDNDLRKQKRKIQKKLRTIAKEEKREGKEVKVG
jgi:hypothetical protein